MTNPENQHESTIEHIVTDEDIEAQIASVPVEFPDFAGDIKRGIPEEDHNKMEERAGEAILLGDIKALSDRWKIEQRLGAINTAKESGTISTEVANALELDALRKMREMILNSPGKSLKIPLSAAHELANKNGIGVNVPISDYESHDPRNYELKF